MFSQASIIENSTSWAFVSIAAPSLACCSLWISTRNTAAHLGAVAIAGILEIVWRQQGVRSTLSTRIHGPGMQVTLLSSQGDLPAEIERLTATINAISSMNANVRLLSQLVSYVKQRLESPGSQELKIIQQFDQQAVDYAMPSPGSLEAITGEILPGVMQHTLSTNEKFLCIGVHPDSNYSLSRYRKAIQLIDDMMISPYSSSCVISARHAESAGRPSESHRIIGWKAAGFEDRVFNQELCGLIAVHQHLVSTQRHNAYTIRPLLVPAYQRSAMGVYIYSEKSGKETTDLFLDAISSIDDDGLSQRAEDLKVSASLFMQEQHATATARVGFASQLFAGNAYEDFGRNSTLEVAPAIPRQLIVIS